MGWLHRAVVNDLARCTEEIALRRRIRLNLAAAEPLDEARPRRLPVPVKRSDREQVQLQNHEQESSESASNLTGQSAEHGLALYRELG